MFKLVRRIKRNIKAVKVLKEMNSNIGTDDNRTTFNTDEINAEGYIMRKNTMGLAYCGISIAGMQLIQFGVNYVPCVLVDDLFYKMSKETQDFIVQHELGHFTHHQNQLLYGYERNDKMEQEADEYAAQIVGYDTAIEALEEIKDILDLVSFGKNKEGMKEIDRRIDYIKSIA